MVKRASWFERRVSRHLLESAQKSGRNNGLIRGSSIGSKCLRRLGYMVLGYGEQPPTAHSQYVLNFGNAFHDMVQTWMSQMGLVNAQPFLSSDGSLQWKGDAEGNILDTKDGITGHYDGLTQPLQILQEQNSLSCVGCALSPNGRRFLLEFKTISNKSRVHAVFYEIIDGVEYTVKYLVPPGKNLYDDLPRLEGSPPKRLSSPGNEKYHKLVKEGEYPHGTLLDVIHKPGAFSELSRPKDEHIEQATYYASRLDADGILIVYLAKDFDEAAYESESIFNLPIKAFEVDVSEKIIQQIQQKASTLWHYLEQGLQRGGSPESWLPPRSYSPEELFSECRFCPYSYTCHPESDKVKAQTAKKFEQQALANLPVFKGVAFEKHPIDSWGREAAKAGKVIDHADKQE